MSRLLVCLFLIGCGDNIKTSPDATTGSVDAKLPSCESLGCPDPRSLTRSCHDGLTCYCNSMECSPPELDGGL